ncbi:zinc-finger domain-containing protein [Jeotgalibacillus sp. R-1-5s-1]|uniref:zinc-finger domain-containing protein n=1 Tax=Jeotgalibacillus sp. R-1-5s-1 TaxID=2555897 RepID=UPI001069F1DB|nr:zinc-finger domain-containing protein [Jeotgalibacillus sp. R-1-5s-1]TFE03260.1 zinc-finger domain-containing protein [Jeotgalibacillus sp. R-1-5s-1]
MEKQLIINEVDELLQTYCQDCPVKKQLRYERGKSKAHKFCISECSVGKRLQECGRQLS